ncbi:MAG: hypothetical protein ACI4B3_03365 [Prevotella sp.]
MKRVFIYLVCVFIQTKNFGQRTCTVVDMLTGLPLADVRVIADHYERKAVNTNRKGEFIIMSGDYKFLTLSIDGYLTRILGKDEVGDTIRLLSNINRLDEFVVYGKDPMKNAAFSRELARMGKSKSLGGKPSGMDILGLFRRRVSEKKRQERLKAIENY